MKVFVIVAFVVAGALAAPAKLDGHDHHHHHHAADPLAGLAAAASVKAEGYSYPEPEEPSGLYDTPDTTTTTTTTTTTPPPTTTTTTTTTTTPPPPPQDSYLPPLDTAANEPTVVVVALPEEPKTMDMLMPYEFKYDVADDENAVQFAQEVESDGAVTVGEYSVMLPDGRLQIVKFRSDAINGYQAEVTYQ